MKKSIKNTLVLVCICAVVSIILALTNAITAPIIELNEKESANKALLEVMPDGKSFEAMDISAVSLPATVREVYRAENGGYIFKLNTTGYSSGLIIMCGVRADGTVSGAVCLSSTETLGYEKIFGANFAGVNAESVLSVDTVSGATKTTGAYRAAVQDALNAAIILGGGNVDLRTEEEILLDNLSAALPTAEGSFEKPFLAEDISGVDAIYKAKNGAGYVCMIGEQFIAADQNGAVLSEVSEDISATVGAAVTALSASAMQDMDLSAYTSLPSQLVSAKKTLTGNYVLEIKGAGYGIVGGNEYHPASGEYILIRVSLTKEGKIIDCLTVSEEETDGIGSACADEDFYGQFDGKTEETYLDIDAIGGATMTTNGYTKAIGLAFDIVKIFEGGEK